MIIGDRGIFVNYIFFIILPRYPTLTVWGFANKIEVTIMTLTPIEGKGELLSKRLDNAILNIKTLEV